MILFRKHEKPIGETNTSKDNPNIQIIAIIVTIIIINIFSVLLVIINIVKFFYDINIDSFKYVAIFKVLISSLMNPYLYTLTTTLVCKHVKCRNREH